jgi:hypothetical protein
MFNPKEIDFIRAENIKTIIESETKTGYVIIDK